MGDNRHIIPNIMTRSAGRFGDLPAVRWAERKEIIDRTYAQLDTDRRRVAHAMKARGFAGDHIALIGVSAYEWIASYLGLVSGRFTAVPLDAGLPVDELCDLINRSDSTALFLSPKLQKTIRPAVTESCPKLRLIVLLEEAKSTVEEAAGDGAPTGALAAGERGQSAGDAAEEKAPAQITFGDLLAEGEDAVISAEDTPTEDDVCTIIYTSGTTGKSKGVMLTQRNLYDNMDNICVTTEPGTVMLSVLPIHHAYCLVMDWLMGFSKGATLAINDSLIHLVKNIGRFEPHIMLMVPLMIETIYKRLAAADPSIPKEAVGKSVFGANLTRIFSGGAHLDPFYIDAMKEYGVDIFEGYGMSECSPTISSNDERGSKPGSVGKPLANAEVRIENGEVQVRGTSVMQGYYQMPQETAEALADGWLHTGDLGRIDEDGFLFITGRLKNLIILSNGENISPEEIEGALALHPAIGEIVVTGEDNGLCARIYPDPEYVEGKGLDAEALRAELQTALDEYNQKQPTYRALTSLVVRQYPFIKSSTRKIKRPQAEIDEPPEE